MTTLEEIKTVLPKLTLEERADLAHSLHDWADDAWDKQMQSDAQMGKLSALLAKVDADIASGKLSALP